MCWLTLSDTQKHTNFPKTVFTFKISTFGMFMVTLTSQLHNPWSISKVIVAYTGVSIKCCIHYVVNSQHRSPMCGKCNQWALCVERLFKLGHWDLLSPFEPLHRFGDPLEVTLKSSDLPLIGQIALITKIVCFGFICPKYTKITFLYMYVVDLKNQTWINTFHFE